MAKVAQRRADRGRGRAAPASPVAVRATPDRASLVNPVNPVPVNPVPVNPDRVAPVCRVDLGLVPASPAAVRVFQVDLASPAVAGR